MGSVETILKIDTLTKPHELWARPPVRLLGDADADPLFLSIGKALTVWESVEQLFALLFAYFLNTNSRGGAMRAFGSIISAGGRRDALTQAGLVFMSEWVGITDDDRRRFSELMKHFGNAAGRRNDIGHGIVTELPKGFQKNAPGYFLVPPDYATNKNKRITESDINNVIETQDLMPLLTHVYRYTKDDVMLLTERFALLHEATEEYAIDLGKRIGHGFPPP